MIELDFSDQRCPYPVIETRKQLMADPDNSFSILVADESGRDNVTRLAENMGYNCSNSTEETGYRLHISREEGAQPATPAQPQQQQSAKQGKTVVYCNSDKMGQGDDGFGRLLMSNFITTLVEMDPLPDTVFFVNGAINLTITDSPVLEALEKLQDRGVDIANCGLCLDFYEKKKELKVGRVTNMYEIAQTLCHADRVVTP